MISYFVPDMPKAEELMPYLKEIEGNRWYSNFGPLYHKFRDRLAKDCLRDVDPERLAVVSSGTSAIELALRGLSLPADSKVLTSSFTFPATIEAILNAGLKPVICDVDKDSWLLTPEIAIRSLKLHDIAAVVPVAAFGMPVDSESWASFTKDTNIPVVVDAAAAMLNQSIDHNITYAFSLHATKPVGAGEGGLVVSRTKDDAISVKKASNFGFEPNRSILQTGTNAKISEYHCAVGLAQLDRLGEIKESRARVLNKYRELIKASNLPAAFQENIDKHIPASLYVVFEQTDVGPLFETLIASNIESRRLYWPLIQGFPAFRHNTLKASINFSNAQHISSNGLALPFHNLLDDSDIERIVSSLSELLFKQALNN